MSDKIEDAIKRLQTASGMSLKIYHQPLLITFSGGKDSTVLLHLAEISGIPFEVQHSHTTADASETVRFVRQEFKRLEEKGIQCTINYPVYKGKWTSMWSLIPIMRIPPTQMARYCCNILKEGWGRGRFIATGVRWAESVRRKNDRDTFEILAAKREKRIMFNSENDEKRMLFETCRLKSKRSVNPIIDWEDKDVFDYCKAENLPMNPLYCEGHYRVGCVGCPMAGKKRYQHFERWPAYKKLYLDAFRRMQEGRIRDGIKPFYEEDPTPEGIFSWWMQEERDPSQMTFEELLAEEKADEEGSDYD